MLNNFTKKAIKQTFVELLNEKPYAQITVKNIVESCGINRNTFYYHFDDIPSLIKEIIEDDAMEIIKNYPSVDSIEQCLEMIIKFGLDNRKAAMHIHNSATRELYEKYLLNVLDYSISKYINLLTEGKSVNEKDKQLIIKLYKCECFGIIIDWMDSGMREDILDDFHRICDLRKGIVEELISRCEIAS